MADFSDNELPSPKRRWFMKTALVIGAAGAALGGSVFWHRGMVDGKLTDHGAEVMGAIARGVLADVLPKDTARRQAALQTHVQNMERYLHTLPQSLRNEINALLGLLANPPTRYLVTGLSSPWSKASDQEIVQALHRMRLHALPTTQMAYHAVRDVTCVVFFSSADNWNVVAYPGPVNV